MRPALAVSGRLLVGGSCHRGELATQGHYVGVGI